MLVSLAWMIPVVGSLFGGEDERATGDDAAAQGIVLGALVFAAIASTAFAFRDERRGGTVLVVLGGALGVFAVLTAGRNHWLAVMVGGVPWAVVGVLFLLASRSAGGARRPDGR